MNSSDLYWASFSVMGIPFGDGCEDLHRKPFGVPTLFTRRHSGRRSITPGGLLPATSGLRGKVRAGSGVGAAGAFSLKHACSVAAGVSFGYSNF